MPPLVGETVTSRGMVGSKNGPAAAEVAGQSGRPTRPVIVGEVLFDVFSDGGRVLGGAPFNVAWNLQAFGLEPLLVTRIGRDDAGRGILDAMASWGMDTTGVQRDPDAPTGEVRVELAGGEPSFRILPDQAYDNLDADDAVTAVSRVDASLLYHGSLIARGQRARRAVAELRERPRLPVFMDVNLREPWWQEDLVTALIRGARWVKLNQDELLRLSTHGARAAADLERIAGEFRRRFDLAELVVTMGGEGALVVTGEEVSRARPPERGEVVDTVGAGDAFASVWIVGRVRGWSAAVALRRALAFAGDICTIRGATTDDEEMYERHRDSWQEAAT